MTRMIRKPGAPDLYGYLEPKDQMPAFGPDQLTENDVAMVIRYLRNHYPAPSASEHASSHGGVAQAVGPEAIGATAP
jgi:ubiquinol-cytochrome c reductase cytochrome b subunit